MCDGIQGCAMPFWPFKKKKAAPVENALHTQVYERGSEKTAEVLADTSHKESTDFKDAMALFAKADAEEKTDHLYFHHDDYEP